VTICDRRFLWGAWILAASIRRSGLRGRIKFFQTDKDRQTIELLRQFENAEIVFLDPNADNRNPSVLKPVVMLTAETEFVCWIDSDCMMVGDVTRRIVPPNGIFQIRPASAGENEFLFGVKSGDRFEPGEPRTGIPKKVQQIWCADVGENDVCALTTKQMAEVFVIHRSQFDFVRRWRDQINRIVTTLDKDHTIDPHSVAYHMADMSVLNSLLAFSKSTPPLGEYLLDKDSTGFVVHFGARPKPWDQWTVRTFRYFDEIAGLLDWAKQRGIRTPPVPWHFKRAFKLPAYLRACARAVAFRISNALGGGRRQSPEA
jgi:hypothetical protein